VFGAKSALREGFRKKHEKSMKNGAKNERFWDAKTFSHYALCDGFMTCSDSEKVGKSMPKWLQNVMENQRKSLILEPRGRFLAFFMDFGRSRKNMIFRCRSGSSKIDKNRALGAQGPLFSL